ncbi:DUF2790 domain-containing protein [Pseudomonas schmalbachii]|uniref:DUF2790 domain-containing protein n=1 Tax=Pseudomonas schmalbachii TaxID=2816993 RepID=A0ABS3TXB1_9PSED|nr:DUF2790 domain-containing protein [Pseudomonas schmalbachii]MBO3277199.1 DUF2790 domain-containing protein [Pseudomonas schmalbachii]
MKMASVVSALLSSLAPSVFAQDGLQNHGAGVEPVDYHYGMEIDVQKVLHRTDTSQKTGVVPVTLVYEDSDGEVRKLRFLEWGGSTLTTPPEQTIG